MGGMGFGNMGGGRMGGGGGGGGGGAAGGGMYRTCSSGCIHLKCLNYFLLKLIQNIHNS